MAVTMPLHSSSLRPELDVNGHGMLVETVYSVCIQLNTSRVHLLGTHSLLKEASVLMLKSPC